MTPERPKLVLRPDLCDACGRCVDECRHNAVRVGVGFIYVDWSRCDGCGKCVAYCDREAILEREGASRGGEKRGGGLGQAPAAVRGQVAGAAGAGVSAGFGARLKARMWRPKAGTPGVGTAARQIKAGAGGTVEWHTGEAVVVVTIAIVLQVAMQIVLASDMARSLSESGIMLARGTVLALYYALQVALLIALILRRGVGFAGAFKLDAPPDPVSVPLGLSMLAGTWLFAMVYRATAISAGWKPPAADSPGLDTLFGSDAVGMMVTILVVVLLGPFVEELLLRGVLLGVLSARLGRWASIALSAVVFAALHGSLWSFVPMTALGLALGRIAWRRRSLWPAVILHVAYNAVIVAPAFVVGR